MGLRYAFADGMPPGQFGLRIAIPGLGHAPQFHQRQSRPEFFGVTEQLQSLPDAAFDQRTFKRLAQQADQGPGG
jgi:hypothetical protein